jgi:hypothetical protein
MTEPTDDHATGSESGSESDSDSDSGGAATVELPTGGPSRTATVGTPGSGRSRSRRHLVVLAIALVGFVVGITLVVTGRESNEQPSSTTTAVAHGPLLPSLGSTTDESGAKKLVETLDPQTLGLVDGHPTGSSTSAPAVPAGLDLTMSGLQRCQGAVAQQNRDRSLGTRLAAARLRIGSRPSFVVSYALPASGSAPAATRVFIVDARTCRVLGAVDH